MFEIMRKLTNLITRIVLIIVLVPMLILTLVAGFLWVLVAGFFGLFGRGPLKFDREAADLYNRVSGAISCGDFDFIERFALENESFPNGSDPFLNQPWLNLALEEGPPDVARWMIFRGAEVNALDNEGMCPLSIAVQRTDGLATQLIALLLEAGADINLKGTLDTTPLHMAAATAAPETIQFMLENHADPMAWDSDNAPEQPLNVAVRAKREDNAKILRNSMKQP